MTRIVGQKGSRRRRRSLLVALLVAAAAVTVFAVAGAQAVHDTGAFELDGNAVSTSGNAGTKPDDWDRVCHQVLGADCSTTANTNGATGVAFSDDRTVTAECAGGDNCTIFTGGGSKDPSDLSSWNWKTDSGGLPAKDNLQQGFAARYSLPGTPSTGSCPNGTDANGGTFNPAVNCSVVYFGSTRVANNGDAQQGVWFLQNRVGLNPDGTFCALDTSNACTGPAAHKAGDVLIVSDFSVGGATALIAVYKWVDSGGDISPNIQSLGGTPAGGTAECGATTPATGDPFCGLVNPDDGTTSPWPFLDKAGNTNFASGELYEAGINLSLFPGLATECFATVVDESRASAGNTSATSPFATLKDFIIGSFQPCTSGIKTTPSKTSITFGSSVTDSAVVTGSGAGTPTGKVQFFICGPTQLDTSGQCSTGGTQVIKTGSDSTGEPLVADPSDSTKANATSGSFTPTSTGTWCWRGVYQPAAGSQYKTASDFATTECLTVLQIDTNILTAQPAFYPNDSATVGTQDGSNLPANASTTALVFSLYAGAVDSATNLSNCQAGGTTGRVYTQGFAITGGSPTETHTTTNSSVSVPSVTLNSANTAYWRVVYTTGNSAYTNRESKCVEAVTHNTTDDPGPGTKP